MSFNNNVVELKNIEKNYKIYEKPIHRLLQMLPWNKNKKLYQDFYALKDINLSLKKGEVLGLVGQNGAGKSTLLQIICKTLQASNGSLFVEGKITALLELGSGFNPEFTGSENIYMAGAIAGLSKKQIKEKYESIVEFSGISTHINHPVKTYSSGMLVRLAFSVATAVEPDILVIDEALSVGDGAFAKKSFDRIMQLKKKGCTILFCSHNTYQIEVFCDKAIWLKDGRIQVYEKPASVIDKYQSFLDSLEETQDEKIDLKKEEKNQQTNIIEANINSKTNINKLKKVDISTDENQADEIIILSEHNDLKFHISYILDKKSSFSIAVVITDEKLRNITSTSTFYDEVELNTDENGEGSISLIFPKIGLKRGKYLIHVLLMCENAIHIQDGGQCGSFEVKQKGSEVGIVSLPRKWF